MVIGRLTTPVPSLMCRVVRGDADENFRAGDGFPSRTMMLTDPHLIESQGVQPLHQLEVAFESQGGISR